MKKFFKQFTGILAWLFLVGSVFAIVQWNGSKQELSQKSMVFTDDGTI
jgi:preprotein translocase subunit SecG